MSRRLALRAALWMGLLVAPTSVGAEAAPPQPALHPPEPVEFVAAEYPAGEQDFARVVLRLTLDAEGRVTQAEVEQSAGAAFDEAARAASLQSRFTPARLGDVPVAVQILVAHDFAPPAPEPSALEPTAHQSDGVPSYELTVRAASGAERLRRSAQAVTVIETEQAARQSADMGEVLARSEGVGVSRTGGLGSSTRFSLNGLTDDQVRFLIDGLPLDMAGYPFGLANVPVNLVRRVEIYRGVVPVRFGADALGGAVNLVSDGETRGTHGEASYQVGSFGTHRVTLAGRHLHEPSGLFVRASGFYDRADNDYFIDVDAPNEKGKLSPARVRRFHDAYEAWGAQMETGFVHRPWARRLLLRGFATGFDKDLQHNVVMTVPYGDAEFSRLAAGATLRYEHDLTDSVSVDLVGGYGYGRTTFLDVGTCVYDWFGQCLRERARPGEIAAFPRDQIQWQHGAYARLNVGWTLNPAHALRLSIAPTLVTRTGDDRIPSAPGTRDPMSAVHDLGTLVTGLEYEADLFDDRVENLLFIKDYVQLARSREDIPGGTVLEHRRDTHRVGVGDALRVRIADGLQAKASYEWAVRLPRPDEAFGDGVLVAANLQLEPETSHNVNLGLSAERDFEPIGSVRGEVNGFLRAADNLIVLLGNDEVFSYQNVYGARSLGVEASAGWTSPGRWVELGGNGTWQDFRNSSSEGAFGGFEGDRIPNRPWLFANAQARVNLDALTPLDDELSVTWTLRYVHEFFRGWESLGKRSSKQIVPSQTLQAAGVTWRLLAPVDVSLTAEVQNLTDAPTYDFFGAQRPGRAFYLKTTASL